MGNPCVRLPPLHSLFVQDVGWDPPLVARVPESFTASDPERQQRARHSITSEHASLQAVTRLTFQSTTSSPQSSEALESARS